MKQDSIHLLNECHYGIQMAISSIDSVMDSVRDSTMREQLEESKQLHAALGQETADILQRFGQHAHSPGLMTRSMAKLKTNARMAVRPSDSKAAALMADGCHIGVKMLAKQMNRRTGADVQSRDLTRRLIGIEDKLAGDMRPYL